VKVKGRFLKEMHKYLKEQPDPNLKPISNILESSH